MKHSKLLIALAGLALAVVAAWWLQNRPPSAMAAAPGRTGGTASSPGQGGPVAVEVGKVQTMRIEDDAVAVGTLRSKQGVTMRPEVSGRISALGFADGQRVRRGQLLVQLDDTLQKAQLLQAQAQASIARTNLQRNRDLVAQNFVSQSVVDQSQAALEVAEAQVALAQAQLTRMQVLAPFDGIVGIRSVALGDYVKDGADLVTIEDLSSLWVDFRLPERYLSRLKPAQTAQMTLDALPGRQYSAQVEALDSQLDANGRSVLVRARVVNAGAELRGGMFARVRLVFGSTDGALVVPEEALVPMGDQQYVFKAVDGPGGGKVSQRVLARIGHRVPGKVELLDGVQHGDTVVVAGHAKLLRGDALPLKFVSLGAPPAASAPASAARAQGA